MDNSNCGPHPGNTTSDLTAELGGYGYNLFDGVTDPDGWMLLDKYEQIEQADGAKIWGSLNNKITVEDADGNSIAGSSDADAAGTSGFFSFADAGYDSYLIGLKFDGVYSTFLSDMWADDWGWDTDYDDDGKFGLSNLTVFVRNPTSVPEPGIVALLAIGLIGMVAVRRKKTV
mgnify:CR=1 FL=1